MFTTCQTGGLYNLLKASILEPLYQCWLWSSANSFIGRVHKQIPCRRSQGGSQNRVLSSSDIHTGGKRLQPVPRTVQCSVGKSIKRSDAKITTCCISLIHSSGCWCYRITKCLHGPCRDVENVTAIILYGLSFAANGIYLTLKRWI